MCNIGTMAQRQSERRRSVAQCYPSLRRDPTIIKAAFFKGARDGVRLILTIKRHDEPRKHFCFLFFRVHRRMSKSNHHGVRVLSIVVS
jgi:hypothetical protein